MDKNDSQVLSPQAGVVGQHAPAEIVQGPRQLNARKATAGHHECQSLLPGCMIRLSISTLEHVNDVISNTNRVEQRLEVKRAALHVLET